MKTQKQLNNGIIGPSKTYTTPIALNAAYYKNSIVFGSDGNLYFSNGTDWQKPETELPANIWAGDVNLDGDALRSLRLEQLTTAENNSYTGPAGEIVVESTKNTIAVHDGSTAGGSILVSEDGEQTLSNKTLNLANTTITGIDGNGLVLSAGVLSVDPTAIVLITGNQSISGAKSFTGSLSVNTSSGIQTNQSLFDIATTATSIRIGASTSQVTVNNDLVVSGDLIVSGTTSQTTTEFIVLEDKVLELLDVVTPTDVLADGGGIQLNGDTTKEILWVNATDSWTSSENFDLVATKTYKINTVDVLTATTLGSGVVNSSLTSVGTIATGVWNGTTIGVGYGGTGQTSFTNGQLLIGNSTGNTLSKGTLTAGTGVSITNGTGSITIANTDLGSSQNIFKTIQKSDNSAQIDAGNNSDTVKIGGSGIVEVAFDVGNKTITISADETVYTAGDGLDLSTKEFAVDNTVVRTSGNQTIAGTKTFSSAIVANLQGVAATATALQTARSINGVSFDGTSDITITNFTSAITADAGIQSTDGTTEMLGNLSVSGNVSSGTWQGTTVAVGYGGTGQTSYTDGQLLVGRTSDNSLVKTTLAATRGIEVTNGSGSISLEANPIAIEKEITDTEYTLQLEDADGILFFTSNSAVTVTADELGSHFPERTIIRIVQLGTGQITVTGASGVSVIGPNKTSGAGNMIQLYYSDESFSMGSTETWYVLNGVA